MESPGNPNDAIRHQILRYFYDRNAQATSRFGKKGSAVKISDVKRELKAQAGLTQQQVMSNLTYLLDREWVKAIEQRKDVSTRGGTTVPSVVTFYCTLTAQTRSIAARARRFRWIRAPRCGRPPVPARGC
jgi:hypothetical protein